MCSLLAGGSLALESESAHVVVDDESKHLLAFSDRYVSGKNEIQEKSDLVKLF